MTSDPIEARRLIRDAIEHARTLPDPEPIHGVRYDPTDVAIEALIHPETFEVMVRTIYGNPLGVTTDFFYR